MLLSNYAEACNGLCKELLTDLAKANIDTLKRDLSAMGLRSFHSWFYEHRDLIAEYSAQTPSLRAKKKYQERPDILLLKFGAWKHAAMAKELLASIVQADLRTGHSYRDMTALAGTAGHDYYIWVAHAWGKNFWPFEESPFS